MKIPKAKRIGAKIATVIGVLLLFPISIPILVLNRIKRRRRRIFSKAFRQLQTSGLEVATKTLKKHPKITPLGAEHLFEAFEAKSDLEWKERTNAWLRHDTSVHLSVAPGDTPRFHRIIFPEIEAVNRPEKITVIMPAYNAGELLRPAVHSILGQSWRNLELIVVNDKSTDDTGAILDEIARSDDRMRVLHNGVNVGPYVSKNIALSLASGDLITGHDADDLALPDRLERQALDLLESTRFDAVIGQMVRFNEKALLSIASDIHRNSYDGLHRLSMISLMIRRETLNNFGYWDCVRFSADSELLGRLQASLKERIKISRTLTMLCLDAEGSLTNHAEFGIKKTGGTSPVRQEYNTMWRNWHKEATGKTLYRAFSNVDRPFNAPPKMMVPQADIEKLQRQHLGLAVQ